MGKRRGLSAADNWKKKKWYAIIAPKLFNEAKIGETLVLENEELMGKKVTVNMMALTGEMRKKDTQVTFLINKVENGRAMTEMDKYEVLGSSIKRQVRRGRDRIDEALMFKTKDEKNVCFKPFMTTIANTKSSIRTALRHRLRKTLQEYAAANNFETISSDVVSGKLQKEVNTELKKTYPLRAFEIRRFELVAATSPRKMTVVEAKLKERVPEEDVPQVVETPTQEEEAPEQQA